MSVSNNCIYGPVSIYDIRSILGASSYDLGTLCKHSNINKWAIYKPQGGFSNIDGITLAQRRSKHMGLSIVEIAVLRGSSEVASVDLSTLRDAIREWPYDSRPLGGSGSPYRISDFVNFATPSSLGYNHDAVACDADWKSKIINKDNLGDTTPVIDGGSFSFRLNEQSSSNIGSANSNFMPLLYVADFDTNWYLGVIVYIPSRSGWVFFHGNTSLGAATTSSDLFPKFGTNQWAKDLMKQEGIEEFTYIPVLLRDPTDAKVEEVAQRTLVRLPVGKAYCMPSGAQDYKIYLRTPIKNKGVTDGGGSTGRTEFTGYIINGNYSATIGINSQNVAHIVHSFPDENGLTKAGIFITRVCVATGSYGHYMFRMVAFYAKVTESKYIDITKAPPQAYTFNITNLRYKYYSNITQATPTGLTYVDKSATQYTIPTTAIKIEDTIGNSFYGVELWPDDGRRPLMEIIGANAQLKTT